MGNQSGKFLDDKHLDAENEKSDDSVNWDEFDLGFLGKESEPSSTVDLNSDSIDSDLETPVNVSSIKTPNNLMTTVPEKPSMLQTLTNYQAGKIQKSLYLEQLKAYAAGQTKIFAHRVSKTVEAHENLTQAALEGIREKIKVWGKEIMAATDLSMQETVSRGLVHASETANQAFTKLAKLNAPKVIVQPAMEGVVKVMQKTVDNIQERSVSYDKNVKTKWTR